MRDPIPPDIRRKLRYQPAQRFHKGLISKTTNVASAPEQRCCVYFTERLTTMSLIRILHRRMALGVHTGPMVGGKVSGRGIGTFPFDDALASPRPGLGPGLGLGTPEAPNPPDSGLLSSVFNTFDGSEEPGGVMRFSVSLILTERGGDSGPFSPESSGFPLGFAVGPSPSPGVAVASFGGGGDADPRSKGAKLGGGEPPGMRFGGNDRFWFGPSRFGVRHTTLVRGRQAISSEVTPSGTIGRRH